MMPVETRRAGWMPRTRVTDDCKLPCGCWELVFGPPQDQPVLLTSELSLQPPEKLSAMDIYIYPHLSDI